MSELNEQQRLFAEELLEGMIVVDAGPGTGKTHSVTNRYVNIVNKGIDPMDILMLTFTNNAAAEMKDKIAGKLMKSVDQNDKYAVKEVLHKIENIRASTFDSLCLNIVLNHPDSVNEFFEIKETLSRNARLVENETLNREYFRVFYARFVKDHGERYIKNGKNPPALIGEKVDDLYKLICKLMSRGVMPMQYDWFDKGDRIVSGRTNVIAERMRSNGTKVRKAVQDMMKDPYSYGLPEIDELDDDSFEGLVTAAAEEDRFLLLEFVHDVYYEFIKRSITDNRLTFGLAELFAFAVLYTDESARRSHSVDYMMVDEFQDTNELQMKICLLLLKKPNLCVVGDWKQGIYGFRFVSKDNITKFEERADLFITQLNRKGARVPFMMPKAISVKLKQNYRSSALILEKAFQSLQIPGNKEEVVTNDEIVMLDSVNDEAFCEYTGFELIKSSDKTQEPKDVASKILDYMTNDQYRIREVDNDGNVTERRVSFGDIAVLCRQGGLCADILKECDDRKIPAYFQGDIEVMSRREGKLALAWLRYVNNKTDDRGRTAILTDMGYPMTEIKRIISIPNDMGMPGDISDQRQRLEKKKRRPNDLLTSIFSFYGLDNDYTQTVINTLSSAYNGSLLTISDIIRLIEDDIQNGTKYDVDASLDAEAVTIQTIHKSKGLEYPIVIVAGVDTSSFPNTKGDTEIIRFGDDEGIRCTREYVHRNKDDVETDSIVKSWEFQMISRSKDTDYSEERRLLFVGLTRAKQYITMIAGRPSKFFQHYGNGSGIDLIERAGSSVGGISSLTERPSADGYMSRRTSLTPHDLMELFEGPIEDEGGKGTEYGTRVHDAAYLMANGMRYDDSLEEMNEVASILEDLKDRGARILTEIDCVLPVGDTSIKGTIDLLALFDDHAEIHDYKTDETLRLKPRYELQLSIYAHAVEGYYGIPVECCLDYVSRKERIGIDVKPMEEIEKTVKEYHKKVRDGTLHGITF